jgi:hypothetical protein
MSALMLELIYFILNSILKGVCPIDEVVSLVCLQMVAHAATAA